MLYGVECWSLKKAHAEKTEVNEMRILRWIYVKTLLDNISVGVFRTELGIASTSDYRLQESGGYMAPEYITHGQLTEKVDVYSFGVLLLEVATGMPNRGVQTSDYMRSLVSIAWEHFKKGTMEKLFDPNLMLNTQTSSKIKEEIQSVMHIGLLCIQEVASLRPTMSMALQMLSKNIQPLPSPANPPYIPENSTQLHEFGPIHRVNTPVSVPTVSNYSFTPR